MPLSRNFVNLERKRTGRGGVLYSFLISGPTYSHHLIDRRVTFGLGRISPNSSETIQTIAIEKIADWKKLEILVQNLSF